MEQDRLLPFLESSDNTSLYKSKEGRLIALAEPEGENVMAMAMYAVEKGWDVDKRIQGMIEPRIDVNFAPIDHNRDYEGIEPEGERCDCLLFNRDEHVVVFVELKNRIDPEGKDLEEIAVLCVESDTRSVVDKKDREEWLPKAVTQLQQTIERFANSDPIEYAETMSLHKACVSNRRKGFPNTSSYESLRAKFKKKTNFTLYVQTRIFIYSPAKSSAVRFLTDSELQEMTGQ